MAPKHLNIRPEWEEALRSGAKTIDARLVADDVGSVKIGDVVRYRGVRARVVHMRYYASFCDLLAHEDWRRIAPGAADRDEALRVLEHGHRATARETGAVAIELQVLIGGSHDHAHS